MEQEEPWIGLVHVQPAKNQNVLGPGRKGAFAHILALAGSSHAFRQKVGDALEEEGLRIVEISDLSPVTVYRVEGRISQDIEDLITALNTETPVQFDVFDAYREYDA